MACKILDPDPNSCMEYTDPKQRRFTLVYFAFLCKSERLENYEKVHSAFPMADIMSPMPHHMGRFFA